MDYENVKLVNLSSCMAATLPLILCMISKKWRFWGRGKCKVFYRSEFYTHEHKIPQSEPKNYPLTISIHTKLIYGTVFEIWSNMCRKVAPRENPENKPKSEIALSPLLNIRNIQNVHLDISFYGWQMRCNWLNFLCISPKTSKSKTAATYG